MLTPSASSLEVIANKDNAYQVCFTDPAQGSASAEYIFNKKVGEKVAIIYNNAETPIPPVSIRPLRARLPSWG